jgi:hypothetical protein
LTVARRTQPVFCSAIVGFSESLRACTREREEGGREGGGGEREEGGREGGRERKRESVCVRESYTLIARLVLLMTSLLLRVLEQLARLRASPDAGV